VDSIGAASHGEAGRSIAGPVPDPSGVRIRWPTGWPVGLAADYLVRCAALLRKRTRDPSPFPVGCLVAARLAARWAASTGSTVSARTFSRGR